MQQFCSCSSELAESSVGGKITTSRPSFSRLGRLPQVAPLYSQQIGAAKITVISDGTIPLDAPALISGKDAATMEKLLAKAFLCGEIETSINVFLIELDDRKILVDTGAGELFRKINVGGKLFTRLDRAGLEPQDITDILITHIHVDHAGGLTMAGERMFPNALVHVGKPDVDFFLDPVQAATSTYRPDALPRTFEEAVQTVKPYADSGQLRPFDKTTEIVPGVTASLHPGHTPGSAFYALTSEGQTIVFVGDIVHIAALQFAEPEFTVAFDVDPAGAVASRRSAFAEFSRSQVLVAAPHLPYPGIGHIRPDGDAYAWVPESFMDRE
ncbi:MBL fold metallo-hydrolase [Trinickia mobilis]|uniref:MBL fold metallo-hydrolase n=1 Tax=Trinickia mobilis TaxID=2816356 RepID=UPI001A8C9B5F|nr:MBL fold metallo-hydrolase [Trinickia mobilis]